MDRKYVSDGTSQLRTPPNHCCIVSFCNRFSLRDLGQGILSSDFFKCAFFFSKPVFWARYRPQVSNWKDAGKYASHQNIQWLGSSPVAMVHFFQRFEVYNGWGLQWLTFVINGWSLQRLGGIPYRNTTRKLNAAALIAVKGVFHVGLVCSPWTETGITGMGARHGSRNPEMEKGNIARACALPGTKQVVRCPCNGIFFFL